MSGQPLTVGQDFDRRSNVANARPPVIGLIAVAPVKTRWYVIDDAVGCSAIA